MWEPKIATLVNVHEHGRTLALVAVGHNRIGKEETNLLGTMPQIELQGGHGPVENYFETPRNYLMIPDERVRLCMRAAPP